MTERHPKATHHPARTSNKTTKLAPGTEEEVQATGHHERTGDGTPAVLGVWHNPLAALCITGFALTITFQAMQDITSAQATEILPSPFDRSLIAAIRLAQIALLVTLALLATRIVRLGDHKVAVGGTGALCLALSVGLHAVLTLPDCPLAIHIALAALKATAPTLLWLLWVELYSRMDERHVMPYCLSAVAASGCLTLALSATPPALAPIVCATLAVVALALFVAARRKLAAAPFARGESPASTWSFPATIVVLQVVFAFANVYARNTLPAEDRAFVTCGVIVCLVVLLVMALMPRDRHLHVRTLCDVAFPLTLAGLLGLPMGGPAWGFVAPVAAYGGEALFGTYVIVVLCAIAFRSGVNALVLFGFVQAASSLGGLGASAAVGAMRSAGTAATDVLGTTAAGAALALAICYVILSRERGDEATWGVARKGQTSAHLRPSIATRLIGHVSGVRMPAPSANGEPFAHDDRDDRTNAGFIGQPPNEIADVTMVGDSTVTRESLLAACSQVAYEFGLTRREEQVLSLLCRGMSAAQIEETLFVSNSTVKTHTHSVYQKLGIHGRQDVISYMSARLRKQASR